MTGFSSPNYTQTPNDLFDVFMADMSESELRVVLAAVRLTLGYHKQYDAISLTKFQKLTGLSRQGVVNGIQAAIERGLLKEVGQGKRGVLLYELVISIDQSTTLTSPADNQSTTLTSTIQRSRHTKENKKKKTSKTKEIIHALSDESAGTNGHIPNSAFQENVSDSEGTKPDPTPPIPPPPSSQKNPETQAIPELIKAWLDSSGAIAPKAYANKTIQEQAAEMFRRGIQPEHIRLYVTDMRKDKFWATKAISFAKVASEITPWMQKKHVPVQAAAERPDPTPEFEMPSWEVMRARMDELVKKGKN